MSINRVFTDKRYRPTVLAIMGIMAGALLVGMIWAVVAIRTTQVDNTQKSTDTNRGVKAAEETLRIIKDCVQPVGDCYRENAKRSAGVVGNLNEGALAAASFSAFCADKDGAQSLDQIYKCTKRLIKKNAEKEGGQKR